MRRAPGRWGFTFYGVVIAATFAVAYAYRAQIRTRPALRYGVLLLFVMGLGLQAIQTLPVDRATNPGFESSHGDASGRQKG